MAEEDLVCLAFGAFDDDSLLDCMKELRGDFILGNCRNVKLKWYSKFWQSKVLYKLHIHFYFNFNVKNSVLFVWYLYLFVLFCSKQDS